MKITIPMESFDGAMEFVEVDASMPFEMFGFTFATHRRVIIEIPSKESGWVVVEISCGAVVQRGDTRAEAIRKAKETLQRVGEERLRKEVKKRLRQQKKAGRNL